MTSPLVILAVDDDERARRVVADAARPPDLVLLDVAIKGQST